MYPVLVKIGPLTIHTYGFLRAVGVACGLWFIYVQAKKSGLDAVRIMDAAFYTIIISLVGAKLVLFLSNAGYYDSCAVEGDHRVVGTGQLGPVMRAIRELYFDVVRGNVAQYRAWCTPVYAADAVPA